MTNEEIKEFNYLDEMKSSALREYYQQQLDSAIQIQGRQTYIFKLDKKNTELSEIYGEAKHGRIYLPAFKQRGLVTEQLWSNELTLKIYEEKNVDNVTIVYSFDRMVHNLRNLKTRSSGKLSIKNKNQELVNIVIENKRFILRNNTNTIFECNLSDFKNINLFIDYFKKNTNTNIDMKYEGDSEEADNLQTCNLKLLPGHTKYVELFDKTYENCTDVIELGDIIVDDRRKVYQVIKAVPSDDQINNNVNSWISWTVTCELANLAITDSMPNDFRTIVGRYHNGGISKVEME